MQVLASSLKTMPCDDRFAIAVLNLLPFLLKEKPHFLEGPGVYPSLSTKEGADGSAALFVTFAGLELEVMDLIAGFVQVMELYWVLNIKYDPRNKNTFGLIEHFCGLPASKSPSLLNKQVQDLEASVGVLNDIMDKLRNEKVKLVADNEKLMSENKTLWVKMVELEQYSRTDNVLCTQGQDCIAVIQTVGTETGCAVTSADFMPLPGSLLKFMSRHT
ncbi:hypothetical protein HPB50_013972 [Hyalomma asiaticum]|uniref:Uncharacterized protein n=1 Tax=Hyalomma asiaticum TaxID=266040 RepID=A0ACB7TJQ6_HYAAI|nr:hypothetical protein HPB50_013972 [Hyalomma asiaticum]